MSDLSIAANEGITTVTLRRGKVHPLNESYVIEIARCFEDLKTDTRTRAIILTGEGSFFSFGLDVPDLYSYSKDDFARFLRLFTKLYRDLYLYPKPIVAAINGHCIAGGTMLAMSCDCRLMVPGKAKISLNEITFG
ncbi:MAG: enoyl-CoA hydratase/isomerase family protein, partial [candidate division Zixibacteria bacterium]|nr:enoyl-CoA hydratase/isomerase family protein [candidate division Zixibacteria bacterium]